MLRRSACLVALFAAGAALSGCGGGGKSPDTNTGKGPATTIDNVGVAQVFVIHETESKLSPRTILIPRLGYYGFKAVNDGTAAHALELAGPGIHMKTADIQPGSSAKFAVFFKRSATYTLFDPLDGNRAKGMQATVRVP